MRFTNWLLAVAIGVLLGPLHIAPASAEVFRVVVRITSDVSRSLSERIRGQTSDLTIKLIAIETGALEPSLPAQVGSASTIAEVYDADAVVWFDATGTGLTGERRLLVLQTKARRLLMRSVEETRTSSKLAVSESAELETASLIVRLAVQAMIEGGVIGVEQSRIVGSEPTPLTPPPTPAAPPRFETGDATTALPGVLRLPVAGGSERIGFGAAASGGYGYTEAILGQGDLHQRVLASIAASYRANTWFSLALRFDGRYDWHRRVSTGDSSGWVGEPHALLRATPSTRGSLRVGGELGVGFPGNHAPSIDLAAISPELSVFASYIPSRWPFVITSLVGYRIDRSARAVSSPENLSRSQLLSIGVSDTNALLLGIGVAGRVASRWNALGEWTWDVRVPAKGVTLLQSPMRLDAGARFMPKDRGTLELQFLVEISPSARPTTAPDQPLVIVEPRVGVVIGLNILPSEIAGGPSVGDEAIRPLTRPTTTPSNAREP